MVPHPLPSAPWLESSLSLGERATVSNPSRALAPGRAPGPAAPLRLFLLLLLRLLLCRFFFRGRGRFGHRLRTLVKRDLLIELFQRLADVLLIDLIRIARVRRLDELGVGRFRQALLCFFRQAEAAGAGYSQQTEPDRG